MRKERSIFWQQGFQQQGPSFLASSGGRVIASGRTEGQGEGERKTELFWEKGCGWGVTLTPFLTHLYFSFFTFSTGNDISLILFLFNA